MRAGRVGFACAVVVAAALLLLHKQRPAVAQDQAPTVRPWMVTASRYQFDPPRIEVFQDDLVKIDLRTGDIAHSMTIDAYRIAKRVSPGQSVTFEFRADQPGVFPYYCNLQIEDGCRQMRGELLVKPRK
jgi:heme/copper-type cytochrome/quinol oxidase subunit 2